MKPVRLLADAEAEVDAALGWYRRERPHRTQAFAEAVSDALARIGRAPEAYPPVTDAPLGRGDRQIRRAPVRGFAWSVFFLDAGAEIVVIAVAHNRREPGY